MVRSDWGQWRCAFVRENGDILALNDEEVYQGEENFRWRDCWKPRGKIQCGGARDRLKGSRARPQRGLEIAGGIWTVLIAERFLTA